MDQKNNGPLLGFPCFPALWFQDPALHVLILRALEPDTFSFAKVLSLQRIFSQMGDLFNLSAKCNERITPIDFRF